MKTTLPYLACIASLAIGFAAGSFFRFDPPITPASTGVDLDAVTKTERYFYGAEILRVVDGDTVEARIDLGFDTHRVEMLRLVGIDAPEITGNEKTEGLKVKAWLESKIAEGETIEVRTIQDKKGSFHRYLAVLFADGENLNQVMVESGMAKKLPE